jgi:hypothetical protein
MSASNSELALANVEKKVVYDPVVDLDSKRVYFIEKSGTDVTFQASGSTNSSNTQSVFDVKIPSAETIVSRYMLLQVPVTITFAGSAPAAGNLLQINQGLNAFRSWALSQCINTLSVKINSQIVSANVSSYVSAFQHARIYQKQTNIDMSASPSLPDNSQTYHDTLGASNNVLNPFTSSDYWQEGRGAFPFTVVSNTSTSAVVTATLSEPLMISPMILSPEDCRNGFSHVNTLQVSINWGNLNRMWSSNQTDGNAFSSVTVALGATPQLLIKYITPDPLMFIPPMINYPYENIDVYNNIATSVTSLSTAVLDSGAISISQIPSKIYVYARRQDTDLQAVGGYQYSDAFAEIQSVTISFSNRAGILSGATEVDLWRMSVKNGMQISWPSWTGAGPTSTTDSVTPVGLGSIMCIKPVEDFGLAPDQASGLAGEKYTIQIKPTIKNIGGATVSYTLFVVTITDGILTLIEGGQSLLQMGILTKEDVLLAHKFERVPFADALSPWGGSFFSDLKDTFSKVYRGVKSGVEKAIPYAKDVYQIGKQVAPYVKEVYDVARPLLMAAGDEEYEEQHGGRRISRAKLMHRAKPVRMLKYY